MNNFYVYGHYIEGQNKPFYIGKGKDKRAYEKYSRSKEWKEISCKHKIEIKILHNNLEEDEALQVETKLISEYGRIDIGTGCLINKTDGGDGISGQVYSDERREKVRKSASRSLLERLGSEEKVRLYLENQSKTRKRMYDTGQIIPYWKGKSRDEATKQKISRTKTGSTTSKKGKGRAVQQLDENKNVIAEYSCAITASEKLNIPYQTIYTSIYRQGKTNGFYFRYA